MKKSSCLIFLLSLFMKINSQNNIIPNGTFENSTTSECIIGVGNANTFDADILNWKVAVHSNDKGEGAPDWIEYSNCGYNNYCTYFGGLLVNSNEFVVIKADIHKCEKRKYFSGFKIKRAHEAIAVGLPDGAAFTGYQDYTIRYKLIPIKAENLDRDGNYDHPVCINLQTDCQLRVFLSKKGHNNWNDTYGNIKQEIYSANYSTSLGENVFCNWVAVERTFFVNYSGMKNLILYAESGGFIIDDVEIFQKCSGDILIQNKNYNFPLYTPNSQNGNHFSEQSSDYINAGYNVGATNTGFGNVVVKNGSAIVYTAANKITLKPGFKAENGSYFHALIDDCPNADRRVDYIDTTEKIDNVYIQKLTEIAIVKKGISITPNPNNGMFKVLVSHEDGLLATKEAEVIDFLGKIVWKKENILSDEFYVDISSLPKGIYYVKVIDESGALLVDKIINQ